jgi:hypothetical protein
MRNVTVKNSKICQEHGKDFCEKWFGGKIEKRFINHVDSLYYMLSLVVEEDEPLKDHAGWQRFIGTLDSAKRFAQGQHESVAIFESVYEGLEVQPFVSAQMYALHFGSKNNFDFFVCSSPPNAKTPQIMAQIRSNSLWIDGMKTIFDRSYDCIEQILECFGLTIDKTQENRIDYAFHGNYFNNLLSVFAEKDLGKMCVANFERGRKDYNFHTHDDNKFGDRTVESDYFTLGRHTSGNIFMRVYDKTKEVVEQGYKQFFIGIWRKYGLISAYDEYVLQKTFVYGRWESKDKARCYFYYEFGTDEAIKREIREMLKDTTTPAKCFTKRAKGLVPDVTTVTNVEIQTKRKFYDRKKLPEVTPEKSAKRNIYNIFDQMSELIRFITNDTIRFVNYKGENAKIHRHKRPMSDWWQRLRNAKKVEIEDKWEIAYFHIYQFNLDRERQKNATLKKAAKMGVYHEFAEGKSAPVNFGDIDGIKQCYVFHDFEKTLSEMNDNDVQKYYQHKESGHKELKSKLRQSELSALRLANRPPPKLRTSSPVRMFECMLCGETRPEYEMAINVTETDCGICLVCKGKINVQQPHTP